MSSQPQRRKLISAYYFWDRAYAIDWMVVGGFFALSFFIAFIPVYERDFRPNNPVINHEYREQQVSGLMLHIVAFIIPMGVAVVLGALVGSLHAIHHGALALSSGVFITDFVIDFLKNRVGRLRPDFLSRCQWDPVLKECLGAAKKVSEGRRSFPSGHSSYAFSGLGFLFFFLAGKTGVLAGSSYSMTPGRLGSSRILRGAITFLPLVVAGWVAVTRVEDYRHHVEDVIVGSLIGISIAFACYTTYWPNPFISHGEESSTSGRESKRKRIDISQPKLLYKTEDDILTAESFELAGLQDDEGANEPRSAGQEQV
ncbi:lipid phosphate phosphatase 1 [Sistotremastrum niveocremeum HHB9708]|uniref:Lipid phosphate phosphatase 1 n=1 Tax=Sistotremastrum niveocremeum HHB9708 TaxID=1314777 RepID=A0A164W5P3_9AGAM|nr:lipid phosphate phosphatase 1 [Sistotremastrum niveocremeum HHB9708]